MTLKNRLTVVDKIYFQDSINQEGASDVPSLFDCVIQSDEQPYSRRNNLKDTEWHSLDLGWLSDCCGMVSIQNRTANDPQVVPSPEQVKELATKILQIGVQHGVDIVQFSEIMPGESLRLRLNGSWFVRAAVAPVAYFLNAFPK